MILALLQSSFLLAALPLFLLLPGCLSLLLTSAYLALVTALLRPLQGPRIACSALDAAVVEHATRHAHERWVFVNGVAVG